MKIVLTGASGRIGHRIAEIALDRGHSLVCIDQAPAPPALQRRGVDFVQADMADYGVLSANFADCEALIHMAAIPGPGRHPDHVVHNSNVVGSYNALRAAAENGIQRVCQASSVNAIGHTYSRHARYDFFPIDETHSNYSEEPYSLSKWICEQQADAFVRRYETMSIASMRFHFTTPDRSAAVKAFPLDHPRPESHLWAWTHLDAAADACLRSVTVPFAGHEVFFIVAPETVVTASSRDLAAQHFPDVPIVAEMAGNASFFSSAKAERILGWDHNAAIAQD